MGSIDSASDASLVRAMRNTAGSAICKGSLNVVGDEGHLGPTSRKSRSPRIIKIEEHDIDCDLVRNSLMHGVQKQHMFEFSGSESTTVSDVTNSAIEDPDYSPLKSTSKG